MNEEAMRTITSFVKKGQAAQAAVDAAVAPAPKLKLSEPAGTLLTIAARVPVLARKMGLVLVDDGKALEVLPWKRPYLCKHPMRKDELSFDPDAFAHEMDVWSDGERHAALWLLNVWNESYAKTKKWRFDLFACMGVLDTANLEGIAAWMLNPRWP